jgi:hypothetical protein
MKSWIEKQLLKLAVLMLLACSQTAMAGAPLAITLPNATVGQSYSVNLVNQANSQLSYPTGYLTAPISPQSSPTIPLGLNVNTGTGVMSGTPTQAGTYSNLTYGINNNYGVSCCTYVNYLLTILAPPGPTTADTQASLQITANYLQGVFALQNSAMVAGLSYDCTVFDSHGICLSAGGRFSRVNSNSTQDANGLMILSWHFSDHARLGAWIDQNLGVYTNSVITLQSGQPLFGLFGVWNLNPSGYGLEARISAGYGERDMNVTRQVVGTSEPGSGTSHLTTQGMSAILSYNLPLGLSWTASPYLGARSTRVMAGGYTEGTSSAVTTPLTYADLTQENHSALAGLKVRGYLGSNYGVYASGGLERDFSIRGGDYTATGVSGLTTIALASDLKRTRPVASLGTWLDLDKTSRIGFDASYRTESYPSMNSLSAIVTYSAGF